MQEILKNAEIMMLLPTTDELQLANSQEFSFVAVVKKQATG